MEEVPNGVSVGRAGPSVQLCAHHGHKRCKIGPLDVPRVRLTRRRGAGALT
jgi:H+/Cl- antiporter ClcA